MNKIRVRDDDVLLSSSGGGDEFGRFKQVHEWLCEVPDVFIHVPAILVTEIKSFPECIAYIKKETEEGRMLPEIHGLSHKDYAALTTKEIQNELNYCRDWISSQFGNEPTRFYTPWGAGADVRGAHIGPAAKEIGLQMVTCERINKLQGRYGVCQHLKDGKELSYFAGGEIFMHWWEGGSRLKRVVEVAKHGSWENAKHHNSKLFRE